MEQTFIEVDQTLVKEEWMEDEPERDLAKDVCSENLRVSVDPTVKCGEVFIRGKGRFFTFICSICSNPFENLESFGQHIQFHLKKDISLTAECSRGNPFAEHVLFPQLNLVQKNEPPIELVDIKREEVCDDVASCFDAYDDSQDDSDENLGNLVQRTNNDFDTNKTEKFPCPKCDTTFKHLPNLKTHIKKKHGEKEEIFPCKFCNRTYMSVYSLRNHVKRKHRKNALDEGLLNGDEVTCRYCKKTFLTKRERIAHIKSDHTGNKRFACPHCPRLFKTSFYLTHHIYSHTGERPFKCNDCSKRFAKRSYLQAHIACVHKKS